MTPAELAAATIALFEKERVRCLNHAVEAVACSHLAEARRQAGWAAYYLARIDDLENSVDPAAVAKEAIRVHQARTDAAREGRNMQAPGAAE